MAESDDNPTGQPHQRMFLRVSWTETGGGRFMLPMVSAPERGLRAL